jgi:Fe-S cluster assembly protein SufD
MRERAAFSCRVLRLTLEDTLMQSTLVATQAITDLTEDGVRAFSERKGEPDWMTQRRVEAWRVFRDTPKPTTTDEPWRRTDIRRLKLDKVIPATGGAQKEDLPARLQEMIEGKDQAGIFLHADGGPVYSALDQELADQGVILADMDTAVREHGDLLQPLFMRDAVKVSDGYFAAMHGALWSGGTFVYVPKNVQVTLPLHAATWANPNKSSFTHTLVVVEPGAKAILVEEFTSDDSGDQAMHNGVVELIVRDGAQLDYVSVQDWDRGAYNFTTERALVWRDATLHWVLGGLGSRLTKSFIDSSLVGQGSTALMSGVYFVDGRQHLDFDTQQNHMAPNTVSDLLYKGALKDRARSVWQGMIKVFPGAQKTDGYQANRNLILERGARADSIPGLEIEADDVRCTHGATVSQLDPEEVFYIRSRGLPPDQTQRLIVQGFFAPVIERIPLASVRERLSAEIVKKIG